MQPVGFVEQLRHLLDFVDDHLAHGFLRCDLGAEQLRVLQVAAVLLGLEQIEPEGVGVRGSQQSGFAGLARYDSGGKNVRYWLEHRGKARGLLKALEKIVKSGEPIRLARHFSSILETWKCPA